jgi:cobalt-zinc-cadmium efflux system protein
MGRDGHGPHPPVVASAEGRVRRLRWAIFFNVAFIALELSAGFAVGSLALLSDAWHNLTDVLALGIAWFAVCQVRRPADSGRTFGYHRAGILAALANSVLLAGVTLNLVLQAVERLLHPPAGLPNGDVVLGVAAVGVLVNGLAAYALHGEGRDLNLRGVFLHMLGDALVSCGVVIAGGLILFTGSGWPDPVASLLVAVFIFVGAWRILREALDVLMEGTPRGLAVRDVSAAIGRVPGVRGVHHVHVWCLSADFRALSCHVVVIDQPISAAGLVIEEVRQTLLRQFGITHVTIQVESDLPAATRPVTIYPFGSASQQ